MSLRSVAGEEFLKTLENWLGGQTELLVLIQYSRAAGNKDFGFCKSLASFQARLRQLPAETRITVFRSPQLQLRGTVDDEFVGECLSRVSDGSEYAVVDMDLTRAETFPFYGFSAGESHAELREDLEYRRGKPVAVGLYPPWLEDSADVISGYVPAEDGKVRQGVY